MLAGDLVHGLARSLDLAVDAPREPDDVRARIAGLDPAGDDVRRDGRAGGASDVREEELLGEVGADVEVASEELVGDRRARLLQQGVDRGHVLFLRGHGSCR